MIKIEGGGKIRKKLIRDCANALRELVKQADYDLKSRDLAAFITQQLELIFQTVEDSVLAWEKRGYWVKADRFRLEWDWCQLGAQKMREAILKDDWVAILDISNYLTGKFENFKIPQKKNPNTPWDGAYQRFMHNS